MGVLAPLQPVSRRKVSFAIDIIAQPDSDTPSALVATQGIANPENSVQINDLGFASQVYSTTSCYTAIDYHIMSTFASLLPSLQLAFFSKPKPEEEEAEQSNIPGPSASAESQVLSNTISVDKTPTASKRPILSHPSSASSTQSARPAVGDPTTPEGLIWEDGQRVRYDADGNVRRRKEGKRRPKEKQRQETEVS